jgi:hypothetical protein
MKLITLKLEMSDAVGGLARLSSERDKHDEIVVSSPSTIGIQAVIAIEDCSWYIHIDQCLGTEIIETGKVSVNHDVEPTRLRVTDKEPTAGTLTMEFDISTNDAQVSVRLSTFRFGFESPETKRLVNAFNQIQRETEQKKSVELALRASQSKVSTPIPQ